MEPATKRAPTASRPTLDVAYGPVKVFRDEACTALMRIIPVEALLARDLPDWHDADLPPDVALKMRPHRNGRPSPFAQEIRRQALVTAAQKKARRGVGPVIAPRELYADISEPRVTRWAGRDR